MGEGAERSAVLRRVQLQDEHRLTSYNANTNELQVLDLNLCLEKENRCHHRHDEYDQPHIWGPSQPRASMKNLGPARSRTAQVRPALIQYNGSVFSVFVVLAFHGLQALELPVHVLKTHPSDQPVCWLTPYSWHGKRRNSTCSCASPPPLALAWSLSQPPQNLRINSLNTGVGVSRSTRT